MIDDEESVRRALHRLIRSAGYSADEYSSGRQFLASAAQSTPACVVLDLNMPQMSGFEVFAELRCLGHETPVIIITGHDTTEARSRALATGASAYLCKPIDGAVLLNAIREAIGPDESIQSDSSHE